MSVGRKTRLKSPLLKEVGPPELPARQKSQKKSKKDAFILFLGQAETGKSTTLNRLFGGREIAPVERETGTQEVTQFTTQLNSGQLHLIDTPGLGDLNGVEWDSQVLATIETFRASHPQLQVCIPNIVIIVARFNDNRLDGELSSFVKTLKSINYQRSKFLDSKFNNLIIVLTHFMNGSKALRANPEPRIELVKKLVKTYTNIVLEPTIILSENDPDDYDLELDKETFKHDNENQRYEEHPQTLSYLLPTGDSYPNNLITSILQICKESKNELGERIFQEAFIKPGSLQFDQSQCLKILDTDNESTQSTIAKLTNIYFSTRSSEMFSKLNDSWTSKGRSLNESCYEGLLVNLEKFRYRDFDQLPSNQELINSFLIKLRNDYDEGLFTLIEKIFNWRPSRLMTIMKKNVGFGFNIGYDGFTEVCPFEFPNHHYKTTPIIYRLPNEITYKPITNNDEREKLIFKLFSTRDDYWVARMKDFHLKLGQKIVTEGKLKGGYNILAKEISTKERSTPTAKHRKPLIKMGSSSLNKVSGLPEQGKPILSPRGQPVSSSNESRTPSSLPKVATITIAKEYRIGKLNLTTNISQLSDLFESNFYSKVTKLKSFNPAVRSSMNNWRGFFHTFGTHVVKSAYIGGVIEITVDKEKLIGRIKKNGKELNPSNIVTYENELKQELAALFDIESDKFKDDDELILRMETKGGSKLLAGVENFFRLSGNEKLQYFNIWKESIYELPTILDRNVQLIEMKTFVEAIFGKSNETKSLLDSFDVALETLYYTIPKKDRSWKICQFL